MFSFRFRLHDLSKIFADFYNGAPLRTLADICVNSISVIIPKYPMDTRAALYNLIHDFILLVGYTFSSEMLAF